jgi:chromosomal replication initiator protein
MIVSKQTWKQVLSHLQTEVPKQHFVTWFPNSAIMQFKAGVVEIGVPSIFIRDWMVKQYSNKITTVVQSLFPEVKEVVFEVHETLLHGGNGDVITLKELQAFFGEKKTRKLPNRNEIKISKQENGRSVDLVSKKLNPKYTLDSFIVGKDNRLAHAAALAVANKPGQDYNPLFIYGGVGLGKTHLLQAVGTEMLSISRDQTVCYITAEQFMNEIIASIRKYQAREFKLKYRNVDCLIVDDIQFFANKERTQEEFFHTFNDLYQHGKQIILSSDRPPHELAGIDDRLKSRFGSGMVVEVYLPDFETRLAIVQSKCQEQGVILPPEVMDFIAHNTSDSIRQLEGFITQAVCESKLENSTPTIRSVGSRMMRMNSGQDLVGISKDEVVQNLSVRTPEDIIQLVASYYRLPTHEITGQGRKKQVLMPRQVSMFLIYEVLDYSLDSIGDYFGGKNHTTVLHACNKIRQHLGRNQKLVGDVHALKKEMGL